MTTTSKDARPARVEVHRNGRLLGAVGVLSAVVAAAYLGRAIGTGAVSSWLFAAGLGVVAAGYVVALVDARAPLLVADGHGARIRVGRTWLGLPWSAVERLEHLPRRGPLHDGRLVLVPEDADGLTQGLDARGRRQLWLSRRLYGAPFAVPLGLSTRVTGVDGDLETALAALVSDRLSTTEAESVSLWRDPRPVIARGIGSLATRLRPAADAAPVADAPVAPAAHTGLPAGPVPATASHAPEPGRELHHGHRSDLVVGALALDASPDQVTVSLPELEHLRRPEFPELVVEEQPEPEPVLDPVIGPVLAAARRRLGLDVDALAERTRIRPHVIEAVEGDDFGPCGGDFYARGHLRTLARVLGVDATPLLASYDERYAHSPVSARQVFEAELATGATGSLRTTKGGPNWSVLVAALMAVVLAWSVARLVMDGPVEVPVAPRLDGSGGIAHGSSAAGGDVVPVLVRAAGGGAHVEVRDGNGRLVFTGDLAYGSSRSLEVAPPIRVDSSDGSVEVVVDGREEGALGDTGKAASDTFVPR